MKLKINIFLLCTVLLSLFVVHYSGTVQAAEDVVVVVNSSRNVSKSMIKRIFTGQMTRWPDGKSIKVFINKNDTIYESFCQKYIGRNARSVDAMWTKAKVRSGVPTPRRIPSSVINAMVKNSNIFIGFVKRSEAQAGVKVID